MHSSLFEHILRWFPVNAGLSLSGLQAYCLLGAIHHRLSPAARPVLLGSPSGSLSRLILPYLAIRCLISLGVSGAVSARVKFECGGNGVVSFNSILFGSMFFDFRFGDHLAPASNILAQELAGLFG